MFCRISFNFLNFSLTGHHRCVENFAVHAWQFANIFKLHTYRNTNSYQRNCHCLLYDKHTGIWPERERISLEYGYQSFSSARILTARNILESQMAIAFRLMLSVRREPLIDIHNMLRNLTISPNLFDRRYYRFRLTSKLHIYFVLSNLVILVLNITVLP